MAEADHKLPEEWTGGLLWLACMSLWVPSVIYIYSILYIFSFTIFILFINKPVITKKKQWLRQTTNFLKNGLVVYFDWHVCHCGCLQLFTSILSCTYFPLQYLFISLFTIFSKEGILDKTFMVFWSYPWTYNLQWWLMVKMLNLQCYSWFVNCIYV